MKKIKKTSKLKDVRGIKQRKKDLKGIKQRKKDLMM